ncbi:MAG: helicase-related protein, partial [Pseudolabrys sp.]
AVEDKLSDALHERLSERFIDRRTSVLMRRLRENTSLETEIGKTGEVTVEGHVIGRLDGFMFAPDAAAAGSEAKALNAAAQKALASEIEARATKLSQASTEQIVLANEGTLRWSGEAVGRLIAGDDTLRPRVRILADEHLTGPAREMVQTRLDLWLKTHIEKVLAPLFSLSAAEDVTGMARGVAFQLVEALGVLERQRVSDAVKGLDQPARATLRKYGVRFGAYHIYLPLLLKPAPRSLATQLWALKNESPQAQGLSDLLHLAGSGRTSIPIDKETPKPLYRTAGYRVAGERAVRVDILERLADLIRPALSWREGSPGPKPPGAFDGKGFTVTGAMTSLTGASGEDFASILRSLGYRMDRRPKPADLPAEPTAAPAAEVAASSADAEALPAGEALPASEAVVLPPAEPVPEAPVDQPAETAPVAAPAVGAVATPRARAQNSLSLLPESSFFPSAVAPAAPPPVVVASAPQPAKVESVSAEPVATEPVVTEAVAIAPVAPEAVMESAPAGAAAATPSVGETTAAATEAKPAAEQPFIEVWRPAGRPERRPHHKRPARRHQPAQAAPAAPNGGAPVEQTAQATASGEAQPADAASADKPQSERHHRGPRHPRTDFTAKSGEGQNQDRQNQDRNGQRDRQERLQRAARRDNKGDRTDRQKTGRTGRRDRGPEVDRAEREQYYAKPQGSRDNRRDKAPDPNSPFAKLAALKQQLEANTKEGH